MKRKFTCGYHFTIGKSIISWKSKLQSVVAVSFQEAEYIGQSYSVREALWLKQLLKDFGVIIRGMTIFA